MIKGSKLPNIEKICQSIHDDSLQSAILIDLLSERIYAVDQMSSPPPLTAMQIAASGETRWPTILAVLLVGCGLSTTAIILRLITRFAIIRTAGPDDYIIGVAQVWSADT